MTYDQMEYDPLLHGLLIEKYKDLAVYSEFTDAGELGIKILDRILRYIILYNSDESPFYKEADFDERHRKCVEAAKIDLTAENAITSGHPIYRNALLRWFKLGVNGYVFENWWSRKVAWHQESLYLATSLDASPDPEKMIQRKNDIRKNRSEDMKALMDLESQLFSDKKIQKLVNRAANEDSLTGWAERLAEEYVPI